MQQMMRFAAAHASEIAYVFDNLRGRNGATVAPKDQEVAKSAEQVITRRKAAQKE